MGLSFHYKGKLRKPESLTKIIEEVTDIAKANFWSHHVFEEAFPNPVFSLDSNSDSVYGICFSPPDCDVVCITFLPNGELCPFYNLELPRDANAEQDGAYLSVKTQFAGPQIHKQLITIFDYLNKRYFENFDLIDEGNFWETKNEQLLEDTFKKYTNLIEGFDSLLENIPIGENESIEAFLIRIAEIFQKKDSNDT